MRQSASSLIAAHRPKALARAGRPSAERVCVECRLMAELAGRGRAARAPPAPQKYTVTTRAREKEKFRVAGGPRRGPHAAQGAPRRWAQAIHRVWPPILPPGSPRAPLPSWLRRRERAAPVRAVRADAHDGLALQVGRKAIGGESRGRAFSRRGYRRLGARRRRRPARFLRCRPLSPGRRVRDGQSRRATVCRILAFRPAYLNPRWL